MMNDKFKQIETPTQPANPINQPPRSNKKKVVLIVSGALLLIIIAAFTTAVILQNSLGNSSSNTSNDEQANKELSIKQQLAAAYKSSVNEEVDFVSEPVVQESPVEGYKTARISTQSDEGLASLAYFYLVPEESWKFFVISDNQTVQDCDEYNNDDLVNSFVGFTCKEGEKKSFVKLPEAVDETDQPAGDSGG